MPNDSLLGQVIRGVDSSGFQRNIATDSSGRLITSGAAPSTTAAITSVSVSTSLATVLAANTARKGVTIQNEGAQAALVAYSTTASTTAYTVSIPPNANWEMPLPVYNQGITVVSSSSTATLRVTEY